MRIYGVEQPRFPLINGQFGKINKAFERLKKGKSHYHQNELLVTFNHIESILKDQLQV